MKLGREEPDPHQGVHRVGAVDPEKLRRHRRRDLRQRLFNVRRRDAVSVQRDRVLPSSTKSVCSFFEQLVLKWVLFNFH